MGNEGKAGATVARGVQAILIWSAISGSVACAQCQPSWLALPPGGALGGRVAALGTFRGDLVAGGEFSEPASHIALWTGAGWMPLGAGFNGGVDALHEFEDRLVAGGSFTHSGTQPVAGIAAWDGATWSPIGPGLKHGAAALAVYAGELIAGGSFGVARWDGAAWHSQSAPLRVEELRVHDGYLLAAGGTYCGFECVLPRVDRWNGFMWEAMGTLPAGGWYPAMSVAVHGGTVFAGVANSSGVPVQRWDGVNWSPAGIPPMNWFSVKALATFRGDLIAGALVYPFQTSGVRRWNGKNWAELGRGTNGAGIALMVHDGLLVVGGDFTTAGGQSSPYWARWGCTCYADCTNDAQLTAADFACFQTQFVIGDPYADCNNDGQLTVADFGCFQTRFVEGCP